MLLELDGLGRSYSLRWAVRDVHVRIDASQCWAVLGANGSGKSTLLSLILGAIRPTAGEARLDGRRMRRGAIAARRRMMLLTPDLSLTAGQLSMHFGFVAEAYGVELEPATEVFTHWIDQFGLSDFRKRSLDTRQNQGLSRGLRCKIWLATLFAIRPPIWLLDEPHQMGLDAFGLETLEAEMNAHVLRQNGTIVFSTQWPKHAHRLASHAIVLHKNRPAFAGEISEMPRPASLSDPVLAALLRGQPE
ncbi:MAG: ATP-binding cassette domain-containing protein [Planctomycetota bacterium]